MTLRDPSHDDIRDLLGAYAVDAVDGDDRTLVEEHLASCGVCRAEVREHLETVAMLSSESVGAPGELWERIRADLGSGGREGAGSVVPIDLASRRAPITVTRAAQRRWQVVAGVAAAVALVVGIAAAVAVTRRGDLESSVRDLETAMGATVDEQLLAAALVDPAARTVELTGDGATATLVLLGDGSGIVADHALPPLPEDRTYQLWAITGDTVVSAGVLGREPHLAPFSAPGTAQQLAITAEAQSGASAPTRPPLVSASLV